MTTSETDDEGKRGTALYSLLDRPLSRGWCVVGWLFASAIFMGVTALLGGPALGDSPETVFSAWAIAHGDLSCAYLRSYPAFYTHHAYPLAPPLYPLLSGGFAALFRLGHSAAFPTPAMLGPHCSTAFRAISRWVSLSNVWRSTLKIGYLSWFGLLGGVVALLRAAGRGRSGWEPVTLVLVACASPAFMAIQTYFHPQDILATGLGLAGVACVLKSRWLWAGVLLGLALATQQFALLIIVPLMIVTPRGARMKLVASAVGAAAVIDLPFVIATSGRAAKEVLVGTGLFATIGDTLIADLKIRGSLLTIMSRGLPIGIAILLAWWLARRIGSRALEPVALVSLVATSLSLRLVFEVHLWGYYFLAVAVALIALDAVGGRFRGTLIAWLALVMLVFNPIPWQVLANGRTIGAGQYRALPIALLSVAVLIVVADALRRRFRWYVLAWVVVVADALLQNGWANAPLGHAFPLWYWQLILVPAAFALAVRPLLREVAPAGGPIGRLLHGRPRPTTSVRTY